MYVEHGFFFCKTARDRLNVKNIYKRPLPVVDPTDLYHACLAGELYAFANRHVAVDARFERLNTGRDLLTSGTRQWMGQVSSYQLASLRFSFSSAVASDDMFGRPSEVLKWENLSGEIAQSGRKSPKLVC